MQQSRINRRDEIIELTQDGEVLRSLSPTKRMLRKDLEYLAECGLWVFDDLFKQSKCDEVPFSKPANVLRRAVYTLGTQIADGKNGSRLVEFLRENSEKHGFSQINITAPDPDENPFFWCYHLLLREESLAITRDQRSKSSRQLVYAYKNKIPPDLLIGFILQIGGDPILDLYDKRDWDGWRVAKRVSKKKREKE